MIIDGARSWHLPPAEHIPRAVSPTDDGRSTGGGAGDGGPGDGTGNVRPLWIRVLSGRSVMWRVRALHRRIRRGARSVLRWLTRDERASALFEQGRPIAALRSARRYVQTLDVTTWPRMPLAASTCGVDPTLPLVRDIDTTPSAAVTLVGPTCTHAAGTHAGVIVGVGAAPSDAAISVGAAPSAKGVAVAARPVHNARRLVEPLDPRVHRPLGSMRCEAVETIDLRGSQLTEHAHPASAALRAARAVRCHVAPDDDPVAVATGMVALAAQGVALVAPGLPRAVAAITGDHLAHLVTSASLDNLRDDRERVLHCARLRRAAMRAHAPEARWREVAAATGIAGPVAPTLSVLLATKRPGHVVDAVRQIAAQRGDPPQLVVGLHGSDMPADLAARLHARYPGDVVVHAFDETTNLGEVLDALARRADGALVTKWDDDDWYAADHLDDMRWALRYSNAAIVGKAAEFVYLEQLDITMRRQACGAETYSTTLAGGTLTMTRADLLAVGGWPSAARQVDRRLLAHVERHGGRLFRTHGFGYVLRRAGSRRSDQHTWQTGDDYFLLAASDQRPGLDLAFAGFDPSGPRDPDEAPAIPQPQVAR